MRRQALAVSQRWRPEADCFASRTPGAQRLFPDALRLTPLLLILPGSEILKGVNPPTAIAAALLVLAVIVVIRIGKALLFAAMFGALAGGVSLGQGSAPSTAGTHAAIGFGVAAATLLLIKLTRSLMLWLVITGLGVAALFLYDGLRP